MTWKDISPMTLPSAKFVRSAIFATFMLVCLVVGSRVRAKTVVSAATALGATISQSEKGQVTFSVFLRNLCGQLPSAHGKR